MTYESLNAQFRLRPLKTKEDYDVAKEFWDEYLAEAVKSPRTSKTVIEYAEVLSLLMAQYEQTKLDDCEEEEEDEDPTEPEEGDWVTEDHVVFIECGGNGKIVVLSDHKNWQAAVLSQMCMSGFYPNVWFLSDHGNYHILSLEDE